MRIFKKARFKNVVLISILISILSTTILGFIIAREYNSYQNQVNLVISSIIGQIKNKYPEVSEEQIIQLLNIDKEYSETGNTILKQYGIDIENMSVIFGLESRMEKGIIKSTIIVIGICASFLIVFIIYLKSRDRQIEKIVKYIQEINNKNYLLKIDENTEDDLSRLRNELYKITVLLREQADISQKERNAISDAVSDISHQLKTPLTSISIMLDNINENPDMDEVTKKEFINEITRQIEWINWLVISLLKLSKLDAGTIILKEEEIFVKQLIENIIKNMAIPIEIKNIQIEIIGDEKVKLIGDYNWQLEALTNILKNSIEHTQENKKISISYEENSLYTKIVIKDEGIGIAKQDLPHIFERFYKGKNSSDSSIGIGLALAKKIIEKGNGYITCKSIENKGTTFEIKYMKNYKSHF